MLYGKRLRLRLVEDSDAEYIVKLRNDKDIKKYFYSDDPISITSHKKFMEKRLIMGDKYFAIDIIDSNETIGFAGLNHIDYINGKAEYGWLLIDANHKGNKYGLEAELILHVYAFDALNLNKVTGEVLAYNERVIEQHKKIGYNVTGTFFSHIYKNGKYNDVVWVEILKSDFELIKKTDVFYKYIGE